jgi:hypothetical protein
MGQSLGEQVIPIGYRAQSEDTSEEVDVYGFALERKRTVQERLESGASLMRSARRFSLNCFGKRFRHLGEEAFARKIAEAWLQENCPADYIPGGNAMTWVQDSIELAVKLHRLFEELGVDYYVTGGVAAIAYGEPRTTQDLDVVVTVRREDVERLALALEGAGFYVPGVEDVVTGQMRTLQVTEVATISRADLMIVDIEALEEPGYEQMQLSRRQAYELREGVEIYLSSPEDLVINKLSWGYQSQSQKQWRDVLGILKTQQNLLDYNYIYDCAKGREMQGMIEQACREAGVLGIVGQQWGERVAPLVLQAMEIARQGQRVVEEDGLEVAEGNLYRLVWDGGLQHLRVLSRGEDREVICLDGEGKVIRVDLTLGDRGNWEAIGERMRGK